MFELYNFCMTTQFFNHLKRTVRPRGTKPIEFVWIVVDNWWRSSWRSRRPGEKVRWSCKSKLPVLWHHGHYKDQTDGQYSTAPYRGGTLSCMFCGIMVSRKSNLKKHTVLNQTGEKPFTPIFVASWPLRRPNWRSILHCSIQETSHFLLALWHHGLY